MKSQNLATGRMGELIASSYLKKNGFKILKTNFRYKKTEVDIIAEKEGKIHFIEVKTRSSILKGKPYEAVNRRKVFHLLKTASFFLLKNEKKRNRLSLDVISILLDPAKGSYAIDHFQNIHI